MSVAEKQRLTPESYLEIERAAENRSEFVDGEVFAMSGASRVHALINLNLGSAIHSALKGRPCEAYMNDMKVWMESFQTFAYPDLSGLCGPVLSYDKVTDAYENPQFILEVLSPSTESWDRGGKFQRYRSLESLQEYVLVSQSEMLVEVYRRAADVWEYRALNQLDDRLVLDSVQVTIPLSEIYGRVEFGSESTDA